MTWIIERRSGEQIKIRDQNADYIKKRMAEGSGNIIMPDGAFRVSDIKDFRKLPDSPNIIEDVARAFKDPIITPVGIASRWVKKNVSKRDWDMKLSKQPGYRILSSDSTYVTVGFVLPVHQIDYRQVSDCAESEIKVLDKA
jgi:hypothetical protein